MKAALLALMALLPTEAGASSPSPKNELAQRVKSVMPAGWTARTVGLPAGVLAVFQGPKSKLGQATVTVAELEGHKDSRDDEAAVEAAFSEAGMRLSYREAGDFGGPELDAELGELLVHQWVVPGPVSYLVTAAAPKALIGRTIKEVAKAAEALRRPAKKPTEAALDTKPTTRPDGALLGAETVRQAD